MNMKSYITNLLKETNSIGNRTSYLPKNICYSKEIKESSIDYLKENIQTKIFKKSAFRRETKLTNSLRNYQDGKNRLLSDRPIWKLPEQLGKANTGFTQIKSDLPVLESKLSFSPLVVKINKSNPKFTYIPLRMKFKKLTRESQSTTPDIDRQGHEETKTDLLSVGKCPTEMKKQLPLKVVKKRCASVMSDAETSCRGSEFPVMTPDYSDISENESHEEESPIHISRLR